MDLPNGVESITLVLEFERALLTNARFEDFFNLAARLAVSASMYEVPDRLARKLGTGRLPIVEDRVLVWFRAWKTRVKSAQSNILYATSNM
jgi:hypothetical protein